MSAIYCPLCSNTQSQFYLRDNRREYWHCDVCALVFVLPVFYLSADAEKQEYDLHENAEHDEGYRHFLKRLAEPLLLNLDSPSEGLDFGCGPAPVLANLLREAGHKLALYDYFYQRDESVWQQTYAFIAATEVVEHLHHPGRELSRLWASLKPGGYLAVMTKLVIDADAFSRWHYKNDLTHVCFFSTATFIWLAEQYSASLEFVGKDVIFLRKKSD
jgi:hypothetical protein